MHSKQTDEFESDATAALTPETTPMPRFSGTDWIGCAVLFLTLLVWIGYLRVGWSHAHMAGHEFRQAQTALSIQAIDREGYRLDYATPVLGKPWSIPMEFPLY